ncbi:MAG: ATP-binding protein, partial [Pseudomonadales bacterium]|nr:ATP-binding protein [Pseudomonadales bacterium]
QSSRMENIVKDLLLLSSLETKTRPRPQDSFSLLQLLSEIRNDIQQIFSQKSHDFRLDCSEKLQFLGERGELYSAISNLVTNAAKYTPAEGTIMVSAQNSDAGLDIVIRDNGIGIESQHLPRLTERFYRVDVSRSSETGGTGLGLAIVKHIVGRHDGELNIESEVGKGSRFICYFPPNWVKLEAPTAASLEPPAPVTTA